MELLDVGLDATSGKYCSLYLNSHCFDNDPGSALAAAGRPAARLQECLGYFGYQFLASFVHVQRPLAVGSVFVGSSAV